MLKIRNGEVLSRKDKMYLTFALSLPSIIARFTSVVMEYIDASMVGYMGADESASIGLVASTTWLFGSVAIASIAGFSIQAAQRIGAKKEYKARNLLWQSYASVLIFSVVLGLIGAVISPWLPIWLRGDERIRHDATMYFLIYSLSLPFRSVKYLSGSMLQCSGNMKVPGILNTILCVLDVILNFVLIYPTKTYEILNFNITVPGAGLGVAGAALGTALADAIIGLIMLYFLARRTEIFRLRKDEKYFFDKDDMFVAVKLSVPVAFEQIVVCGAMVVTTIIIAPLGIVAIAANSFAITAESLCYMPGYGISDAASTLVGQSVGAGRKDEAVSFGRLCISFAMGIMFILGVLMFFGAPLMMRLLSKDPDVIRLGTKILRIEVIAEAFYGANIAGTGVFRGAGDTLVPSIMNLVSLWAVRITLYVVLTPLYGLTGAWIGMCSELCFRGILFIGRFKSGRWLKSCNIKEIRGANT